MKEKALQFGPGRRLFGMLSLPDRIDPDRPVILIPNTGFEHRCGPHRLHVHLCRAFAQIGFAAFRMDLAGMGDSGAAAAEAQHDPVADQRAAMDEIERLGISRTCIPIGLCSGGHDAHRFTRQEPRAVGAGFLDHYLYHTRRSYWVSMGQRMSEPRRLLNFARRKLLEWSGRGEAAFDASLEEYFEQPDRRRFRQDVRGFMRRRLPLFFLFTGEYQHTYNYPDQLLDVCPQLCHYDLYELHYFAESDHTFSQARMRNQLIAALCQWLEQQVLPHIDRQRQTAAAQRAGGAGLIEVTTAAPWPSVAGTTSAVTTASSANQTAPVPSVPPSHLAAAVAAAVSGVTVNA